MIIIGITGTIGAGKGTLVEYLKQKAHFRHFSVREFLTEEILRRQLPVNRDSMTHIANELRATYSPSYIIDQLYNRAVQQGDNAIIESIRTPGEVLSLRKKDNFFLFAIDADPAIRYQRIVARASETDHIDYQTFLANEAREMQTTDPNKQNLRQCIAMADFYFDNNGTRESLEKQLQKTLQGILPSENKK
ncbi:MAG TPA: AAA family ATPase [Bacteroidales bacterium]|nr:AAA family ATPase [Bacteroidales bacterium]